jgi:mono/diheme cytochrome c family protein
MLFRFRISIAIAFMLAFALAVPVLAGGWAVITLDELPAGAVAGEPLTIGFTVLQHGRTPMSDLDPTITARSGGEKVIVFARPEGKPGHYSAMLTFPKEGEWEWTIQAFTMDQKMPSLSVAAPVSAPAGEPVAKTRPVAVSSLPTLLIARGLAFGIGLIGLVVAFRRRSRLAGALTALCLVVGVGSFMKGSAVPAVEAESASSPEAMGEASDSQVELGQQLFVAKGCITCHVNTKVPGSEEYWTIDMGATNLSTFSASPEILRIRLKDPTAAKSDTQMPNLGLSEAEIEALIAFINSR